MRPLIQIILSIIRKTFLASAFWLATVLMSAPQALAKEEREVFDPVGTSILIFVLTLVLLIGWWFYKTIGDHTARVTAAKAELPQKKAALNSLLQRALSLNGEKCREEFERTVHEAITLKESITRNLMILGLNNEAELFSQEAQKLVKATTEKTSLANSPSIAPSPPEPAQTTIIHQPQSQIGSTLIPFFVSLVIWVTYSATQISVANQEFARQVGAQFGYINGLLEKTRIEEGRGAFGFADLAAHYWYIPLLGAAFSYLLYFIQAQKKQR